MRPFISSTRFVDARCLYRVAGGDVGEPVPISKIEFRALLEGLSEPVTDVLEEEVTDPSVISVNSDGGFVI